MAKNASSSSPSRPWREGAISTVVAALCLTASFLGASPAQDDKPAAEKPVARDASAGGGSKHGEEIFLIKCLICHNKQPGDDSPFGPPNLNDAFKTKAITTPQAEDIITHGKGQMPAFGNILTKSDMASVIAYIKSGK